MDSARPPALLNTVKRLRLRFLCQLQLTTMSGPPFREFARVQIRMSINKAAKFMTRFSTHPPCLAVVTIILLLSVGPATAFQTSTEHASPVDRSQALELVSDDFGLADGPAWDGSNLYVPDVKKAIIKKLNPTSGEWKIVREGDVHYSASVFSHGKLYVSNNSAAKIESFAGNHFAAGPEMISLIDDSDKPDKRPNDLVVDQHGGIYFTLTKQNQVIYISPAGASSVFSEAAESPNGITISPDNSVLYVAAYRPKKIIAIRVKEPGRAGAAVELAKMNDGEALGADGMTVDRAGNIYCAGATDVWIWDPAGNLLDNIACPTRPINCTFGDQDMKTLYITGFGGVYKQRMKISGPAPEPPIQATLIRNNSTPPTTIPANITPHLNTVYAEYGTRKLLADIFVPVNIQQPVPAVVLVHGGGWLKGDKVKFRALAIDLAKRGFVTAAIEYRLGGEAHFPAGMHDCSAAVRFLRANASKYNIDASHIGAVGGSAGGHLAGLMASGWNDKALHGEGGLADQSSRIQVAIVMAGPLQTATGSVAERSQTGMTSNATEWLGATIDESPELYRLADAYEHISADTCPIFFLTGDRDNPARNQPARDRLTQLGIPTGLMTYQDAEHGCWNRLPWFSMMNDDIEKLLNKQLASSTTAKSTTAKQSANAE